MRHSCTLAIGDSQTTQPKGSRTLHPTTCPATSQGTRQEQPAGHYRARLLLQHLTEAQARERMGMLPLQLRALVCSLLVLGLSLLQSEMGADVGS